MVTLMGVSTNRFYVLFHHLTHLRLVIATEYLGKKNLAAELDAGLSFTEDEFIDAARQLMAGVDVSVQPLNRPTAPRS